VKPLPKKLLSHMKLTIMTPKSAVLALAVVILSVTAVQAVPTTYVYIGNPFTIVHNAPYTTNDFVTAMVKLASPLPANLPFTEVTPLAFTMFDGIQTITNLNTANTFFQFATGPSGSITNWVISTSATGAVIQTRSTPNATIDLAEIFSPTFGFAENIDTPGRWSSAVPDAGSSLALLSQSLTALGVAARQFKRAAA
jgi:hypothetical protein